MKDFDTIIIGGGAAGLFCAAQLKGRVLLLERNERLGRKLSATGNGQGNLSNVNMDIRHYFSDDLNKVSAIIKKYGVSKLTSFFEKLGGLCETDERGRIYPTSRQASAITDLLRFYVERNATIKTSCKVTGLKKNNRYCVSTDDNEFYCKNLVICTGGKAAKNFGTDGNGFSLLKPFGHSVTDLYPALVQLKTDTTHTKQLRGIRIKAAVKCSDTVITGDVIFTEYGLSGDAVFRISSLFAGKSGKIYLDLLPSVSEQKLREVLERKLNQSASEPLCGILHNQIGRAVLKRSENNINSIVNTVKNFELDVVGSLDFDYAQVTRGGIPMREVDINLQSIFSKGMYLAGEILNVDGECGGYNLQWAFSSASVVAETINKCNYL